MNEESENLVKVSLVAKRLGISVSLTYNMITRGELPAYKIGGNIRLKMGDVEAYLLKSKLAQPAPAAVETVALDPPPETVAADGGKDSKPAKRRGRPKLKGKG